jgi:ABC-type glycerol-3-phosphate transport system permease component
VAKAEVVQRQSVSLFGQVRQWTRGRLVWLMVIVFVLWTAGPLSWSLLNSFKPRAEIYQGTILPQSPTLDGYRTAVGVDGFEWFLFNSIFLATVSTVIAVFVSALAAYAVSRFVFRWRHALLLFVLLPRLVPRVSLIVPLYQILVEVGLLNTYLALIITYSASNVPLGTWILVGFFRGVPREIEEAAEVDGANMWQRMWRVVLPLALPGLITVAVLSFRDAWNEFPFVLAFTTEREMRTLPYALFLLDDALGIQDWAAINAFALLTILPIVLIYLIFERKVVAGLTSGALK